MNYVTNLDKGWLRKIHSLSNPSWMLTINKNHYFFVKKNNKNHYLGVLRRWCVKINNYAIIFLLSHLSHVWTNLIFNISFENYLFILLFFWRNLFILLVRHINPLCISIWYKFGKYYQDGKLAFDSIWKILLNCLV